MHRRKRILLHYEEPDLQRLTCGTKWQIAVPRFTMHSTQPSIHKESAGEEIRAPAGSTSCRCSHCTTSAFSTRTRYTCRVSVRSTCYSEECNLTVYAVCGTFCKIVVARHCTSGVPVIILTKFAFTGTQNRHTRNWKCSEATVSSAPDTALLSSGTVLSAAQVLSYRYFISCSASCSLQRTMISSWAI